MSRTTSTTPVSKTWQKTKSENTRHTILDAAIRCFYEYGYNNTTTEKIANDAGVSRGAMLHHFPSRADLIKAAVRHLNERRLEMFAREEDIVQSDATHSRIEEGIDTYWAQLNTPYFVVFHELQVAARTDPELNAVLVPAIEEFDRTWLRATREIFPDLAQSREFLRANALTLFLLEGLAANRHTRKPSRIADELLAWLKAELRRLFTDVKSLDRQSAKLAAPTPRKPASERPSAAPRTRRPKT
jgi:AcrR family transcriptional regulator